MFKIFCHKNFTKNFRMIWNRSPDNNYRDRSHKKILIILACLFGSQVCEN